MFQFLTHVELSRSMAAILEMPQYVAYQKMLFMLLLRVIACNSGTQIRVRDSSATRIFFLKK